MPVILTKAEQIEQWMSAPIAEALALQLPLREEALRIVARGLKEDRRLATY
jgi:putative SOS response-associated peptidase YedK